MKNLQVEIDARVAAMVGDLQRLVYQSAVEAMEQALPAGRSGNRRRKPMGAKRSSAEIVALTEGLYEEICASPGETMTVLSGKLAQRAAALALPIRRLVESERVRKTGGRQYTRYYPVGRHAPRSRKRRGSKA